MKKHWMLLLLIPPIILASLHKYVTSSFEIYATTSPDGAYQVNFVQERWFLLLERYVYLNVNYQGIPLIENERLFRGDWLEGELHDYYPDKFWKEPNVFVIGDGERIPAESIEIKNTSHIAIKYMLIETYREKILIFNLEPDSNIKLNFNYSGILCVQAETSNGEKFRKAIEVEWGEKEYKAGSKFEIVVNQENINIEAPQRRIKNVQYYGLRR